MSEKPGVTLDFETHWCARHLEPFRVDWPGGAGVAMVRLVEAALADERLIERAPKDASGLAKVESLDALLREHSPLCCWLGDERLVAIYEEVGKEPPR